MEIMTGITATLTSIVFLLAIPALYLDWLRFLTASRERETADLATLLANANIWIRRHAGSAAIAVFIVTIIKMDDTLTGFQPLATAIAAYAVVSFSIAVVQSLFAQRIEAELKVCGMAKKPFHRSV